MDAKDRKKTFVCEGTGCKCWGVGCPEVIGEMPKVGESGLATGYNWISSKERLPENNQKVFYYF